ncbi:NOSTRIN (predicted) [Pycnogonum litorale]
MSVFQESFWGPSGFDELRKHVKQGHDFCKDVTSILHERSELENTYSKSLQKLAQKLAKASKDCIGTVAQGWQHLSTQMEHEADIHKNLSIGLEDELVKMLKSVIEAQHKIRKKVEARVDKSTRVLNDRRTDEVKSKKTCYSCAKENERVQEQMLDAKIGKSKMLSDKDFSKLESKRRKAEEATKRADTDYYSCCVRAERARQEWECSVFRGCGTFQNLEQDRLTSMSTVLTKHSHLISVIGPRLLQIGERLIEGAERVDVSSDIQSTVAMRGTGPNMPEQILPDFYAEDVVNVMNPDRRREVLEKLMLVIKHDIERERKSKQGVEHLARAFSEMPTFGDEIAQSDVHDKLENMKAMLRFFEASRYKIGCSLCELEGRTKPTSALSRYMLRHKDKMGMVHSVLRGPQGGFSVCRGLVRRNSNESNSSSGCGSDFTDFSNSDRGTGDGTSAENDAFYEEQFHDFTYHRTNNKMLSTRSVASAHHSCPHELNGSDSTDASHTDPITIKCRALYDYEANMYDELTIHSGDVINVYNKESDDWWQGELNGSIGIFPATYVEEITQASF